MNVHEKFWAASVEELARGYTETAERCECLICGEAFEQGVIYPFDDKWMDARRAVQEHIATSHKGALHALLSMDKKYTGLSENQQEILGCFAEGLDDKASAERLDIALATVRNYRFRLREKAKQARVFLAIMDNIDLRKREQDLMQSHRTATMVDERYATTREEQAKVLKSYIDRDGRLRQFPSKEKKKIVILGHLAERFEAGRDYTEPEVNEVIAGFADDYVTLRRYLIQYGFMEREDDCSAYRLRSLV